MEEIEDKIEHIEVSAIVDSNGDTIEDFNNKSKSKRKNKGIYININQSNSTLGTILGIIGAIVIVLIVLFMAAIIVPAVLIFSLLLILISKIKNIFRK